MHNRKRRLIAPSRRNNWGRGGSRGWPGAPTWSSAYLTIPGVMLQYGADQALAETHYEGLAAHVDFLARQAGYGDGVPQVGDFDAILSDWLSQSALIQNTLSFVSWYTAAVRDAR